jgi:hypothetical protein
MVPLQLCLVLSVLATGHLVHSLCLAVKRTLWTEWIQAWWPPLSCFWPPLSCFWRPLMRSSLPAWLPWEPSEWIQSSQSPLAFMQFAPLSSPWASLLGWSLIIVHRLCASIGYYFVLQQLFNYSVLQLFNSRLFDFFCSTLWLTLFSSALFNLIVSHSVTVRLLCLITVWLVFDHYSIIVLILEMYSRYFDPKLVTITCNLDSININPFSHWLFYVSRLTAICHMRHPYKADLGKKWRQLWCLCVRPSARTRPAKYVIQNKVAEAKFYVFRYNFACRPLIWILKRVAESSEHADSESILFVLNVRF